VKGRISGTGQALLTWNTPLGTFEDAGRPTRKEQPEKRPSSAPGKGRKPELTADALGGLVTGNGKFEKDAWVIERDRLLKIARGEFTCTKATVEAILAKYDEHFEEGTRDGKELVIYRAPNGRN
jgi:hypothetical protein